MRVLKSEERAYFNFDLFSEQSEYRKVNYDFVSRTFPIDLIQAGKKLTIIDLACGTGLITSMIVEILKGAKCKIFGIDPNPASIEIARRKVQPIGETEVEFCESYAEEITEFIKPESVDVVYFCNAIHEIPTDEAKQKSLNAISKVLKRGGKLFINSTFTKESYTPDTVKFWGMLKLLAFQALGKKRDKNASSFEILSVDDYKSKIEKEGFVVNEIKSTRVELSEKAMLAICEYDAFIKGVFIDMEDSDSFSLQQKSDALKLAVKTIIAQVKEKAGQFNPFARNWIEFSCVKI
ncbi:class I SAM-dependent methyltransferase [Candidatus Chrysopegis kryptomonas]|jgi:ubiquinone/menaquinone biosynthesis C-methylase UbiE|uniref:Ubiquinone/menaquinone biosynthesis C-methylase UbiE n=1 Tax=Candidatus Chryseopegocella kryptomonas TaxID=1633643 RepID=A0A0P1MTD8_9BACT|nr:class I SAM-dependent methyltransferase [Candidatus Chrysopegis kryptomonas]CUS99162.1 Ubiquinone/menaquinone biosynthesis C-methylase UbiE [Candidatus Chrysopegis kryptomonas]